MPRSPWRGKQEAMIYIAAFTMGGVTVDGLHMPTGPGLVGAPHCAARNLRRREAVGLLRIRARRDYFEKK